MPTWFFLRVSAFTHHIVGSRGIVMVRCGCAGSSVCGKEVASFAGRALHLGAFAMLHSSASALVDLQHLFVRGTAYPPSKSHHICFPLQITGSVRHEGLEVSRKLCTIWRRCGRACGSISRICDLSNGTVGRALMH